MNKPIVEFIVKQTCASICCTDEQGNPYCFSCFYVLNSDDGLLYFKSSAGTKHGGILQQRQSIAGTILPDKLNKLIVKGIQFEGRMLRDDHPLAIAAPAHYYKKNPAALAIPGEIWVLELFHIKMTDSTLGFGKKIIWDKIEVEV
jgi:uncharacterized protein YhbP (UPF0306 family)